MRNRLKIPRRQTIQKRSGVLRRRSLLSRLATAILLGIALVSFYFLVAPFLPRLWFWIARPHIDATSYQQAANASKQGKQLPTANAAKPGNRIILPSIGLDAQIFEGRNIYVIGKNQGVWHETSNTDPSRAGNIVLAGHRWMGYDIRNIGQFYNLPELTIGSKLYIRWNDKVYEYEVYRTRSVYPTETDIRDPDPSVAKKLTMYTCYPLGSIAKRFVVEAKQL